jgi:hypothetical protein
VSASLIDRVLAPDAPLHGRTEGDETNRLLKKTHLLRCRSIASLQRTVSTPPLVDFSRASHLDLFEQPARAFFGSPARAVFERTLHTGYVTERLFRTS